jgi:DNA-binding NarL/FixJ family response regulator
MRVLVADDHALFRDGIVSLLLARDIEVVAEAGDGEETVAQTRALRPDVVLMDIKMPGLNGIEATRLIKAELPDTKIVILTAFDDDDSLFEAIKSGADGYILKNLRSGEFFDLLNGLDRGEAPISPALATKILREFSRRGPNRARTDDDSLTDRELEVLRLVAGGAPNREIAAILDITENTVKYHLRRILDKLHLQNRAQVMAYALRHGLISSG